MGDTARFRLANRSCVEEGHPAFALPFPLFFSPPCEGYELEVSKPRVIIKTVDGINLFDQAEAAEIPIDAPREIIVNRFAHASYVGWGKKTRSTSSPTAYPSIAPGAFPDDLNPEDFVERTVASRLRNEFICDVLYKCGCVETWGTGLAKAYSLCFEAGIRCGCEKEGDGFWFIFHRNAIGSRTRSTRALTNLIK